MISEKQIRLRTGRKLRDVVPPAEPISIRTSNEVQSTQRLIAQWALHIALFGFIGLFTYTLVGTLLQPGLDEGIYLEGAQRILAGKHLYSDFFALTGPGTFWLFSAWFRLFSTSLAAAHALLSLEIGVIAACAYLITAKFLGKLAGFTSASVFLALLMSFVHRLYVNHRWDSACCLLVAVTLVLLHPRKSSIALVAGVAAGCAAVFTPPALLVPLAICVLLVFTRDSRLQAVLFAGGVVVPLALAVAVLAVQGSLIPMLQSFAWVSQHYSQANRVPYGFTPPDPNGVESTVSVFHEVSVFVPAALPILACAAVAFLVFKRRPIEFSMKLLLAGGLALAASCYPRVATNNLLFAAPLFMCLLLVVGAQLLKSATYRTTLFSLLAVSAISVFLTITSQPQTTPIQTQLGTVECNPRDWRNVQFATSIVSPGETLFVFPYQPIWYSLTGGMNPTRYDFLQPGMMTLDDETEALRQLTANPPQWVIWHNLPPRTILAIWPHSDPATLHFRRIEQFIRTRYSQVQPADRSVKYAIAIFHRIG